MEMTFGIGQRIGSLQGAGSLSPFTGGADEGSAGGPTFAETLQNYLGEVSQVQDNASDTVQAYLRGEPVELHQVMAASEEAGIALEMLVELRNKMTEAYRTIINMQS